MTASGEIQRTWGRTEAVRPHRVERPATAEAVQRAVVAAAASGLRVKAVGAGHSFSGIAIAPDVQLDLADLSGLIAADRARARATFGAGTPLHRVPALLAPHGLAMANLGSVDRPTIAGAISTGMHGTGLAFPGLSAQVVGVRLVTGTGELLTIDEAHRPELLPAVALGLGALGLLVDVTLQLVPAFLLHAVERPEPLDAVLDDWPVRVTVADHTEFSWFPHTSTALTTTNTRLPGGSPRHPLGRVRRLVDDEVLANGVFGAFCAVGAVVPALSPTFARVAERVSGERSFTDRSHAVFTSRRRVRFREMEYAVPLEAVPTALREIRARIDERGWRIGFPIEVRAAAADDVWMSTAYGRPSGYLAVHRYHRDRPDAYFDEIERILLAHDGRPHWGTLHSLGADEIAGRVPRFGDFLRVRDELDPDRVFANAYLRRVLGA